MSEETNSNVAEKKGNDSRRSMLKGAAAMAAAAVAASVPRAAQAAPAWPCTASLKGPYGLLTLEDVRGNLHGRILLDGVSAKAAQQIDFIAPTPRELININLVDYQFNSWEQNTLLGW